MNHVHSGCEASWLGVGTVPTSASETGFPAAMFTTALYQSEVGKPLFHGSRLTTST